MFTVCHAYCSVKKFMAKSKPFYEFLFDSTIINDLEIIDWLKSQTTVNNDERVLRMTQQYNSYLVHKLLHL